MDWLRFPALSAVSFGCVMFWSFAGFGWYLGLGERIILPAIGFALLLAFITSFALISRDEFNPSYAILGVVSAFVFAAFVGAVIGTAIVGI